MKRKVRCIALITLFLFWLTPALADQSLQKVVPESVGLSSERLERVSEVLKKEVENGEIAGAVGLIMRHGKVAYLESIGMLEVDAGKSMQTDTIFRIASMAKPITTVAIMMLYEEGHFLLEDPVSKFIPEFKDPKVLVPDESDPNSYTTVPAKKEISIRHLLNHTSGLTYQFMGKKHLAKLYKEAGLHDGLGPMEGTLEEKIKVLATLPLSHHPGEVWDYGMSTDVLGYLVEVISGMQFDRYLDERIFGPLDMQDTYFYLPKEKYGRLAVVYSKDAQGNLIELGDGPFKRWADYCIFSTNFPVSEPRTYFSGGSGLVSTASDYAKFCQMILNGGEFGGGAIVRSENRRTHVKQLHWRPEKLLAGPFWR